MKLALSSLAYTKRSLKEFLEIAEALGFEAVEVILDGRNESLEILHSYSFNLRFHAPFSDINIASLNPGIREESLKQIRNAIRKAAEFDAPITVHSGRLSPYAMWFREKAEEMNFNAIKSLAEQARDVGIHMLVENMPAGDGNLLTTPQELEKLCLEAGVGVTLDVGHAETCDSALSFISRLRRNIQEVHLHDNNLIRDEHLAIGDGRIDFRRILRNLHSYNCIYVIEVHREADVEKSRQRLFSLI